MWRWISASPSETVVEAVLTVRPKPQRPLGAALALDGEELKLLSVALDGKALGASAYEVSPEKLVIPDVPDAFTLTLKTQINPAANTRLMGLYRSNGVYCTQCEADAFRRITYFLDRPM